MMLAGVEWQVDENGTLFRETASGEALMSILRAAKVGHWGRIETHSDPLMVGIRGESTDTEGYPTQDAAAVAVLALARKRAAELLELAGESTTPEPRP